MRETAGGGGVDGDGHQREVFDEVRDDRLGTLSDENGRIMSINIRQSRKAEANDGHFLERQREPHEFVKCRTPRDNSHSALTRITLLLLVCCELPPMSIEFRRRRIAPAAPLRFCSSAVFTVVGIGSRSSRSRTFLQLSQPSGR
jgi:hypothetical protein